MRLAIVGNSHISAFAQGWPLIRERHPHVDITFFGGIKGEIKRLKVEDGALVARRPRGREWLMMTSGRDSIPGDFDRYVVLGLGFGAYYFLEMLKTHRPMDLESPAPSLMSRAFMEAGADSAADGSAAAVTIRNLRRITRAPITVLPCPYISVAARELEALALLNMPGVLELGLALYRRQLERLRWDIVEQPATTLEEPGFTKARYTRGATHFLPDQTLTSDDFTHMNAEFGALYLDMVLERFAAGGN